MTFKFPDAAVEALKSRLKSLHTLTATEAREIGSRAVDRIKSLVASGQSPIEGPGISGRFAPYKKPERYPGKRKPSSPVNLKLTGAMLDDLRYAVVPDGTGGFVARVGYSDPREIAKESGHREGVNGQPRRPTIPDPTRGESFVSSVRDAYRKVVLDAIRKR